MSTLNFNIGVLGHVDSGKTSLAKALSTVASTACFDKNPQSKERGITLDLGFSSFTVESSEALKKKGFDFIQYTLVDCPGHASLIKTIIGGAQIIDMMMLVIDIQKGIQTQTAECLLIGEICCNKMLVVINKLDLIEESKRASVVDKMTKRLLKTLESTKFANSCVVAVSAFANATQPNNEPEKDNQLDKSSQATMINIDLLIKNLRELTFLPERKNDSEISPFLFSVDHCFTIKGQGTVMTGTILNGQVKINDNVEIPILKSQKKVKSIQVFRKPVEKAVQGDRCGICISNFDSKQFERGVVCSPGYLKTSYGIIICLNRIRHFKGSIETGSKFHITIGHETLLAKIDLFAELENSKDVPTNSENSQFDFSKEYLFVNEINANNLNENDSDEKAKTNKNAIKKYFAFIDFDYESNVGDHSSSSSGVLSFLNSLLIGSKLDTDIHLNQCRLAFYGNVLHQFTNKDFKEQNKNITTTGAITSSTYLSDLKVYKEKTKEGIVDRKHDEMTVIGRSLFKKETNMDLFVGLKVSLSTGEQGVIEGSFGQSGKFRIRIPAGILPTTKEKLDTGVKSKQKKQDDSLASSSLSADLTSQIKIYLNYKRFVYNDKKKLIQ